MSAEPSAEPLYAGMADKDKKLDSAVNCLRRLMEILEFMGQGGADVDVSKLLFSEPKGGE